MSGGDPPIVITGGSVTIDFDKSQLQPQADGKHHHPDKHIKRIEVTGDGINFAHDFKDHKVTIRVIYGNP
jgi:hypothetical protein